MNHLTRLKLVEALTHLFDRTILRTQIANAIVQSLPGGVALLVGADVDQRAVKVEKHHFVSWIVRSGSHRIYRVLSGHPAPLPYGNGDRSFAAAVCCNYPIKDIPVMRVLL